ncbi:MAG: bifunctional homocysteine S-methyltransferase/methylenetetrahydrofolate reductase [Deltaproteobacteria bacterium]|nr:bifunctional homocysteine S-methyltransferase/methylenetetrahydrofolate reductase [Deltaproteobacteria bacterium]
MTKRFLELLDSRKLVLFDGGMGTLLYSHGIYINRCFDELNLTAPDLVAECHAAYVKAGADVVETNTFGANRLKLTGYGLEDRLEEINRRGVELARQAAGNSVLVAGAIGPLGIKIEPWGPTSTEEARELFAQQARALAAAGVDLIILETFGDLNEIHQALAAARAVCDLPVVAQMTLQEDGNSLYGTAPETFAARLEAWGASVVGVNCSVGPEVALQCVERIVPATHLPVSVQPNAGVPRAIEGRNLYLASPEYFEEYAKRFVLAGARIVGGCCGTTPEHIRAMRKALYALAPESRPREGERPPVVKVNGGSQPVEEKPLAERSSLARKIALGQFVTSIELVPPRGVQVGKVLERARRAREAGVDAINIPDGPRASARMSSLALAVLIERDAGLEALLHYTCRDRNLLGMQSDLLGAHALGLRNLLLITGDPPKMGDYPDATAVFDVDSIGLTNMVTRLNRGLDLGGNSIGEPTAFAIGVGVNPGAPNLEFELKRFFWKVDAGAHFAITQPVFDVTLLESLLNTLAQRNLKIPVLAGLWPLVSLRNAEFMNNEVPGATVPEPILRRMAEAQQVSPEQARRVGVEIATEILERIRPMIAGVQISPPMGRIELALQVLGATAR